MLRSALVVCGAALLLAGCEAQAQVQAKAQVQADEPSAGIPELISRCVDGLDVEGQAASCTHAIDAKVGSAELQALARRTRALAQGASPPSDSIPELISRCVESDFDGRVATCDRAIDAKVGSREMRALAHHARALGQCWEAQPKLSIADETQAIALVPNFPEAYAHRANCRMASGDPKGAQADYTVALRLAPDVPGYYQQAADIDNWAGDHDSAIRRLDQLIRMKPDYNVAVDLRAKTLFNLGRYEEAAAGFAQAVKMFPGDAPVVLWLHLARMRAGQPDAAEFAANTAALRLAEWPKPILDYYAGRVNADAVMDAGRAIEDEDGECQASLFIAEHLLAKGDRNLAAAYLGGATSTCDPGSAPNSFLAAWAELKKMNPQLKAMGPW